MAADLQLLRRHALRDALDELSTQPRWKCQSVSAGGIRKALRDGPPSQQAGISDGKEREQAQLIDLMAHRYVKVDWPCRRSTALL